MIGFNSTSLKNKFAGPILILITLSVMIILVVTLFHQYKSRLNDSIIIAKRQATYLDVIDNSAHSAIEGNRESLTKLDQYKRRFEESLKTLHFGGNIEDYTKDRMELLRLNNGEALDIIHVIRDEWEAYKINLNILIHNFNDKTKVASVAKVNNVQEYHSDLMDYNEKLVDRLLNMKQSARRFIFILLSVLILGMLLCMYFLINNYNKYFRQPIAKILSVSNKMGEGNIQDKIRYDSPDELGKLSNSLDNAIDSQSNMVKVIERIGDGDFNIHFQKSGDTDILGNAVESMRSKLQQFFEEDKRKSQISNWTNKGLAKFAEILRHHNDDINSLLQIISSELCTYVDGNQCAIYSLEGDVEDGEEQYLELLATYAWKRKKHLERRIDFGEGLVGQCVLERDTIFLTEVPDDYVEITSGLGKSNPSCILIVPMKINDEIYGVIEIASFKIFEPHEVSLIEKIAISIASSISTVKTNDHTRRLLEESQLLTEQMRAQEEELRQNAEELQATQESIEQKLELLDFEKQKSAAILETCVDGCISFNQYGKVEVFNKAAENIWMMTAKRVIDGNINTLMPLKITKKEDDKHAIIIMQNDDEIELTVRTSVTIKNAAGENVPVLLTANESKIGDENFFTVFAQEVKE